MIVVVHPNCTIYTHFNTRVGTWKISAYRTDPFQLHPLSCSRLYSGPAASCSGEHTRPHRFSFSSLCRCKARLLYTNPGLSYLYPLLSVFFLPISSGDALSLRWQKRKNLQTLLMRCSWSPARCTVPWSSISVVALTNSRFVHCPGMDFWVMSIFFAEPNTAYYHLSQEKQAKNIVEKLYQRFRLSEDPRQWCDIAFCFSLLLFKSERSVKKLIEGFQFYRCMKSLQRF